MYIAMISIFLLGAIVAEWNFEKMVVWVCSVPLERSILPKYGQYFDDNIAPHTNEIAKRSSSGIDYISQRIKSKWFEVCAIETIICLERPADIQNIFLLWRHFIPQRSRPPPGRYPGYWCAVRSRCTSLAVVYLTSCCLAEAFQVS